MQSEAWSDGVERYELVGLAHYGEIALKGNNRPLFVRQLAENLRAQTDPDAVQSVTHFAGRLVLRLRAPVDGARVGEQLARVFGINSFALAHECPDSPRELMSAVEALARSRLHPGVRFRVKVLRGDKSYPQTSLELARGLGDRLRRSSGAGVSLESPDVTVFVELAGGRAFVYFERTRGLAGLPVGVGGHVLCLLSGGIDSAVAAWLMMKRGCTVELLHIHPFRTGRDVESSKIVALARRLASYGHPLRLHLVPFFLFETTALAVDPRYEALLFRRFLLRLAEELARKSGASGLVTGDNLGQVASQTLENLAASDNGLRLTVLRPLLTYDKNEIVELARRVGTYELSLQPYKDCCSLLARHPETRAPPEALTALEARVKLLDIVHDSLAMREQLELSSEGPTPLMTSRSPTPPLIG